MIQTLIVLMMLPVGFLPKIAIAQSPSFDCKKATTDDERIICGSSELSRLDNIIAAAYEFVRQSVDKQAAANITLPMLRARQACGADYECIKRQQTEAIKTFRSLGAPVDMPERSGSGPLALPAVKATRCHVTDPTGTPLNVRSSPNGRVVGILHNDEVVVELDKTVDSNRRLWAYVGRSADGSPIGWIFREFVSCP